MDHGKSTLIKALTGMDPDRLREEQERGMTIDLGFAWLRLPGGQEVSIVDVPGHERFIHNMLAGVGGIDIALLVVAADEGIMPQTREHLAILDLLNIKTGVVAITKCDLVDEEWLDLVKAEIEEVLAGTSLAGAPMLRVSAVTGQGLASLLAALERALAQGRPRPPTGKPRLPIDRVFTMLGFGTVVTGTLVDGEIRTGQELEVQPRGIRVRVRGLQTHRRKVDYVSAGTRVAVNLTGVDKDDLRRGDVLAVPGWLRPTRLIDVRLRALKDLPRPIKHNMEVTFHSGTAETAGKLALLDTQELEPGKTCWAQIRLQEDVALAKGDLFIVRVPSPSATIGGGTVVEPHPRRHRRFQENVLKSLAVLEQGTAEEVLLQHIRSRQPTDLDSLLKRAGLPPEEAQQALGRLVEAGDVVVLDGQRQSGPGADSTERGGSPQVLPQMPLMSRDGWERLVSTLSEALRSFHATYPLRRGMPREELRARLGLDARTYTRMVAMLQRQGLVSEEGPYIRLATHQVTFMPDQEARVVDLLQHLERSGASPPGPDEILARLGSQEVLQALLDRGDLVQVSPDVIYSRQVYDRLVSTVVDTIRQRGKVTVAEVRDLFNTSRKYALALLTYMDEQKVTRRVGDDRVLY